MKPLLGAALHHYDVARGWIVRSPFYNEPLQQHLAGLAPLTEQFLLREHAWVTLNSGFREAVVRRKFGHISLCFCDWESAQAIVEAGEACILSASASFANQRKLTAILDASKLIWSVGFSTFAKQIQFDPLGSLSRLPYMGRVTTLHLAKNLGMNVVKPDRHLVRLASRFGFPGALELCEYLSERTGDEAKVVDLVLWRYEQQGVAADLPAN